MVIKVVNYGAGGPRGPEGPALEQRISDLESTLAQIILKMDRIDAALQRLEPAIRDIASKFSDLNARVAGVEGQLRAMPTFLQLMVALISTWAAGTAIVFALLKATHS
jgi:septal ring factor EnvC (AmiA/AmiB activator)